jgi:GNAT superfamily N-acetyltransferase
MLTFDIFEKDSDAYDIYPLVEAHLKTIPLQAEIDPEHVLNLILSFNTRERPMFLLRSEDKPVGYLAAIATPHPFFPSMLTANSIGWYVDPAHRKEASWALIDAYEQWAQVLGCKMISLSNYNIPKLTEGYESRGYKSVELMFIKELN